MSLRRRAFILLILIGFLIVPFRVNAVELKKTFEEKISKTTGEFWLGPALLLSYDNEGVADGYVIISNFFACGRVDNDVVIKYDLNNKRVFRYTYGENNARFTVENNDNYVVSTLKDADDNILWQKKYGDGNSSFYRYRWYADYDKEGNLTGYVVLIDTSSFTPPIKDDINPGHIVIKYDKNGNILWQKNQRFIYKNVYYYGDYGYYVDENKNYFLTDYYNYIKYYSFDGNLLWQKSDDRFNDANPSYINDKLDGMIVIYDDYFIKYDLNGDEVFRIQCPEITGEKGSFKYVLNSHDNNNNSDGYMAFSFFYYSEDLAKTFLTKYDYQGNIVWSDTIDNFQVAAVTESYDKDEKFNGYILVGKNFTGNTSENGGGSVVRYTYPKYDIVSDNDKGGVITVGDKAFAGDTVKVEVKAREGYVVKRIIVKDEDGNEIEVKDDGTFVMPEGKVTVSAIYERITNPDTVSACYMILGIILVISISTLIIIKQKEEGK